MTENTTSPSELHLESAANDFPDDFPQKADVDSGLQPAVEPAPKHGAALDIVEDGTNGKKSRANEHTGDNASKLLDTRVQNTVFHNRVVGSSRRCLA